MKYKYYSDPAYGWLKVPISHFKKYGIDIDNVTSSYSYVRKDYIYLEEDNDMPYFLISLEEKGIKYSIEENFSNKSSKIRSYMRFTPAIKRTIISK